MRFIGNNHAIHFGGVTFVNRVTLAKYILDEMARFGKSQDDQQEVARFIADAVDQMEEELRNELKQKHYHSDLRIANQPDKV
jgi:hypothetical protein